MNVHAEDKASKKNRNITITNNKGRLSKEEIEELLKEAEKNKEEDNKVREKIEAKNNLESTLYHMKNSLNEDKFKRSLNPDDKSKLDSIISETSRWIDCNS